MASAQTHQEPINLVSSDHEASIGSKHSRHEQSDNDDDSTHRTKRLKPTPAASAQDSALSSGEEGEIDEDSSAEPSGAQTPAITQTTLDRYMQVPELQKLGSGAVLVPTDGPLFTFDSVRFKLPVFPKKKKTPAAWDDRFQEWVQVFCAINADRLLLPIVTPGLIRTAFVYYLDLSSGLTPKKKKKAKLVAQQIEEAGDLMKMLNESRSTIGSTDAASKAAETQPSGFPSVLNLESESEDEYEPPTDVPVLPPTGKAPSATPQVRPAVTDHELALLRKYFPSAEDHSNMCLLCGRTGHTSASCSTVCKFCSSSDHWEYFCPTRTRCTKCRQLGHQASACVEKLALTRDEGLCCALCDATDHLEDRCTLKWRSYFPEQETIHVVASIQPSCSMCGSDSHYSYDCGQQQGQQQSFKGNPTFSLRNRDLYVKPGCGVLGIEDAAQTDQKGSNGKTEHKIRGYASRTGNVVYSEGDDSDVEFLGNRPVRKPPLGQIRMSSNIQLPHQRNGRGGQPPLPPGPPPPGPPPLQHAADYYSPATRAPRPGSRPPPPSLPAKPPPRDFRGVPPPPPLAESNGNMTFDSHQNNRGRGGGRGRRGGRGGRGGRGRGRGQSK